MRSDISRQLYISYVFIIMYGIVIVQCQIYVSDGDDFKILSFLSETEYPQNWTDGSGISSDPPTDIPTITSIITSSDMQTSDHTDNYTTDTTLQTTVIPSTSSATDTTLQTTVIPSTPSATDTTLQTTVIPSTSSAITTSSSTTSSATTSSQQCNDTHPEPQNDGTCISKSEALKDAVSIIRGPSNDSNATATALIRYFRWADNLTTISNMNDTLTPREIDELIRDLRNVDISYISNFLIFAQPKMDGNETNVGVATKYNSTNEIIKNTTKQNTIESDVVAAAAIINDRSLNDIHSINMFIMNDPKAYRNFDLSNNQSLVSPVIIASVNKTNNQPYTYTTFYLKLLSDYELNISGRYFCSFLDTNTWKWNRSGCSEPKYNETLKRHECTCNHLTTFALIWIPNIPQPEYLTSQDIASIVFLSLSIICFIAVIIYSLTTRLLNPEMSIQAHDLLPLISSASTTILFIFYIALSMTVFTRTSLPLTTTSCFTSASVLMFITYFFLIFMFCIKTSVGYFNYIRFVRLFPQPSSQKLLVLLIISFFISITWTSFAAGFNSNSSYNITQLHGNKLCWFTRDVIYYFMTIPISIFILLNFIMIIFVAKRIIRHARYATAPHQSYKRMRQCILVLLSSCVTQGIGWLFGLSISFIKPDAANVLSWFFVIFNGLEGLWTILLFIIIRCQHIDEPRRIAEQRRLKKKTPSISKKNENKGKIYDLDSISTKRSRGTTDRKSQKGQLVFDDLYNEETIDWETSTHKL